MTKTTRKDGTTTEPEPTLEAALARLEAIAAELEQPEQPLEQSLALFREGIELSRQIDRRLGDAEMTVERLIRGDGGDRTEPLVLPQDEA